MEVNANSANKIPGVVMIDGCTATIVSSNTLITAAHCIKEPRICVRNVQYPNLCTQDVFIPDDFETGQNSPVTPLVQRFHRDIAVGVFPKGSFKEYFEVAKDAVSNSDEVVLVGYSGHNNPNQSSPSVGPNGQPQNAPVKRWGYNFVFNTDADGANTIVTQYGFSESAVGVSPGDSGGPMFRKCQLVGIASRMGGKIDGGKDSLHTNIQKDNLDFLEQLKGKGAVFCGLDGADPSFCSANSAKELSSPPPESNGKEGFPCGWSGDPNGTPPAPNASSPNSESNSSEVHLALAQGYEKDGILLVSVNEKYDQKLICINKDAENCDLSEPTLLTLVHEKDGREIYQESRSISLDSPESQIVFKGYKSGKVVSTKIWQIKK